MARSTAISFAGCRPRVVTEPNMRSSIPRIFFPKKPEAPVNNKVRFFIVSVLTFSMQLWTQKLCKNDFKGQSYQLILKSDCTFAIYTSPNTSMKMVHIMNIRPDKQRTGEITTNGIPYQLIQQIIQVNGLLITGLSEKTIRKFMSCDFKMALR